VIQDSWGRRHLCNLQIWDTAGQERFQSLGKGFYRGADCALLVYDITDPQSLENLDHWRAEFLDQVGGIGGGGGLTGIGGASSSQQQPFPFVVVGNKVDKEKDRLVPPARVDEWLQKHGGGGSATAASGGGGDNYYGGSNYYYSGIGGGGGGVASPSSSSFLRHYECSAKTSQNVDDAFQDAARSALEFADYKRRTQPSSAQQQLFVPPATEPIDLRRAQSSMSDNDRGDACC